MRLNYLVIWLFCVLILPPSLHRSYASTGNDHGKGRARDDQGKERGEDDQGNGRHHKVPPADLTAPSVAITAPASDRTVSGTVPVTADATDNVGVAGVQFTANGVPVGRELTVLPYALRWDTTTVSDGNYTLQAVARDRAGNRATSSGISVTVKNGILFFTPQDTYLNLDRKNYSRSSILRIFTWPDHRPESAILMKFDLSTLPPTVVVQQATLSLALTYSDKSKDTSYTVTAQKVIGKNPDISAATGYTADGVINWTSNRCCYNGIPLAQGDISPPYATQTIDKKPGFKSWTITSMVQDWVSHPLANFGVLLNADPSKPRDRYRYFASSEYSDKRLRPSLRVQYTLAADTTPPAISITAPAPGVVISGTVTVSADATDNVAVAGVQFQLDGAELGAADTTPQYSLSWDTTKIGNGIHRLTAIATDTAGNRATSAGVTVVVANNPATDRAIAARYPGDTGIETDPDVLFVEKFDEASLPDLFLQWNSVLNGAAMLLGTDVPPGSASSRSLEIPWVGGGVNDAGALYKVLSPGIDDRLFVRYYIKYPVNGTPHHSGIWMGGFNPPSAWPDPDSGAQPSGSDRFIASAEQNRVVGSFDHYDYWMGMRPDEGGAYFGNFLLNNPAVQAKRGQWMCVEHMVKLNNPLTAQNGEHAIWLDGVLVSHLGEGFPNGTWSGGIFTQDPNGSPFPGFQWRNDANLNINWIWLQNYAPDDPPGFSSSLRFANVVVAKSYVGCLAQ